MEEARRLFFVAATRAEKNLLLTFPAADDAGKPKSESRFLAEIDSQLFEKSENSAPEIKIAASSIFSPPKKEIEKSANVAREILKNFQLSATAMENFRLCPRKFFYENLLRAPRAKSNAVVLGTAVHAGLENFFSRGGNKIEIAIDAAAAKLRGENLTENDRKKLENAASEILTEFLNATKFDPTAATELDFRGMNLRAGKVAPIVGKIDRIEFLDPIARTVRVVEFKTSKPKSANEIRAVRASDEQNRAAGKIFRQLKFAAVLLKNSNLNFTPIEFSVQFLRPNPTGKFIRHDFEISPSEISEFEKEIAETWSEIANSNFTKIAAREKKEICGGGFSGFGCEFADICWGNSED